MSWKIHTYDTVISESGLDSFGHLNNAAYLRYFEDARWALMNKGVVRHAKIMADQKGPVMLEVNLRFKAELKGGDKVKIQSQVLSNERKITRLLQQIILPDGRIAADATFKMGFFDMKRRKLIDPTPEWLETLGAQNTD